MDKEELRAKAHILNPALWILDNEFINENQKPIEFDLHRFMLQPYSDSSPDQVIMKSAQIGWSIAAIFKSIHACKYLKLNVIYALPTRAASAEFVVPKVNPMLQRNPVLKAMVRDTDNKNVKAIGDRFIFFRGTQGAGEAISTSADLIIADEFDHGNQLVLMLMQSRLQASEYAWNWRFSNPTLPGFGVHELFQSSDQMHWFVKCRHCNHNMYLDFESGKYESNNHYIDKEREIYACGKCHKEISDDDRQGGEWVAKYPTRERRGYWINQLMIPWVSAKKILKQQLDMDISSFHNMVLGLPYQASEYMINREAILNTTNPDLADKREVMMGCDSGKVKHYVLGNSEGVFNYGKTENWDDVERLIQMYNATCVIDALPDFTVPEKLARKYPGKVFVNYYVHDSKSIDVINRKEGTEFGVINSDRTKLLDLVAAEIASRSLRFFQEPKSLDELIWHCEQAYRVVEPDTRGILRARWETKVNRPDHFLHALAYYRIARSMAIGSGTGGVTPSAPMKGKPGFYVKDDKVKVKDALGMPFDDLIEKSLRKNRKHKIK